MTAELVEDMLAPDDEDLDDLDEFWSGEPDYDRPVGRCANCGDTIFRGQGGPTVHDYCASAFAAYLNSPEATGIDFREE